MRSHNNDHALRTDHIDCTSTRSPMASASAAIETSTQATQDPPSLSTSTSHHRIDYYEQQILHDATSLSHWIAYIESISHRPIYERIDLYRRAIQHIPSSYNLWWV